LHFRVGETRVGKHNYKINGIEVIVLQFSDRYEKDKKANKKVHQSTIVKN
jgi:hypothetical protein